MPANADVLDLGLADGSVAAVLQQMGCRVWGVELDEVDAEAARPFCQDVVVGDLNTLELAEVFPDQRFDVVLMLDVLEHLADPARVLRQVTGVLADGGWGVISLPNVAHVSLRLSLLDGHFDYTEAGLLDRTHLRFFDRQGVDTLLDDTEWTMLDLTRVTRRFGTTEIKIDDADPDLVKELEAEPEGLTYQFVITAVPSGSGPRPPAGAAGRRGAERPAQGDPPDRRVGRGGGCLRVAHLPDLFDELNAIQRAGGRTAGPPQASDGDDAGELRAPEPSGLTAGRRFRGLPVDNQCGGARPPPAPGHQAGRPNATTVMAATTSPRVRAPGQ